MIMGDDGITAIIDVSEVRHLRSLEIAWGDSDPLVERRHVHETLSLEGRVLFRFTVEKRAVYHAFWFHNIDYLLSIYGCIYYNTQPLAMSVYSTSRQISWRLEANSRRVSAMVQELHVWLKSML